jgi:hypothetical protein
MWLLPPQVITVRGPTTSTDGRTEIFMGCRLQAHASVSDLTWSDLTKVDPFVVRLDLASPRFHLTSPPSGICSGLVSSPGAAALSVGAVEECGSLRDVFHLRDSTASNVAIAARWPARYVACLALQSRREVGQPR